MKYEYASHYDDQYWTGNKRYTAPDGTIRNYHGPSLTWDGFDYIADALTKILFQTDYSLLDIGCGAGDLAARMYKRGWNAYGIDISTYAIDNCVPEMRDRLVCADITAKPSVFGAPFNLVMATDLLEHIYEDDLDETFDWMLSLSKKFLFFCVATVNDPTKGYQALNHAAEFVHKRGEVIPREWEGTAVAGHVNVRRYQYWMKFFRAKGLKIRFDLMYLFQMEREFQAPWRATPGWNMSTTYILEVK